MRALTFVAAVALAAAVVAPSAALAGLSSLAGLTSVNAYEATFSVVKFSFAPGDAVLINALNPLTKANQDFGPYPSDEPYDIFYSNASGGLDANGSYITIQGTCGVALGCFNINGVSLNFGGTEVFANTLTAAAYGRAGSFIAGSASLAADASLATFTRLGDTIGLDPSYRMSITVGFTDFPDTGGAVPEPAAWTLMLSGFFGLGAMLRRRRAAVVAA